jgi:hypothetical protein
VDWNKSARYYCCMNQPASRTPARSVAMLAAMLLISALVTAIAAYLALEWMPCSWFGSGFEGACGYGAVWSVAAGAFLLWPVLFLAAAAVYFRRGQRAGDTSSSTRR